MENLKRYYACLGITPGASLEQIRQAYADAEKAFHAERFADDPQLRHKAQDKLSAINEAYLALLDAYEEVQASLDGYNASAPNSGQATPPEGACGAERCMEPVPSPLTDAPASGAAGKEPAGVVEHTDRSLGTPQNDEDTPDPFKPLRKEIVRLLLVLAAVIAILLASRLRSGRSLPELTEPAAPSATSVQTDPDSIRRDADNGNARAQALMGYLAMEGKGMRRDMAEAAKWFGMAAAQGNTEAQDWLGYLYETGQGVPKDYREAARWYQVAAEQGNVDAQKNLGLMYANGKGVAKSSQDALAWLRKAAEQGDGEALRALRSIQAR